MRNILLRIRQVFSSSAMVAAITACAAITIYALWYASAGRFSTLVPADNAYIGLGEAFLHGQLSLLEKPSPEFLALQNPYDPAERTVPFPWDASYYNGRYYLYWGPVPALAFAAIEGLTQVRPPGALLVVLCYIGLPVIFAMILYRLWTDFFPHAPGFSIGACTLMGFINLPILFLLARPVIYETAIIAGQFFLFVGLFAWVMYMRGASRARWLVIAGLSWGLAIGSRYTLAISITIYLVFALVRIIRDAKGWQLLRKIGSLLIPLTLCIIGLGIYNFARFGDPFETGMKYRLSIPDDPDGFYSTSYILSNLFIYLFYPMTTARSFPFIISTFPVGGQFDEIAAGLIPSVPGIWLLALAIPSLILSRRSTYILQDISARRALKPFVSMILLAALGQFLFLTFLFYAAMRYMADYYLQLVLGIWILVWRVDESIQSRGLLRAIFWLLVTVLVIWTVGIGFFGSFDIPPQPVRLGNPDLYMQIASYWDHRHAEMIALLKALGIIKEY